MAGQRNEDAGQAFPGFGLGGVVSTFGLKLDLIGFLLFLVFVLVSSVMMLARPPVGSTP